MPRDNIRNPADLLNKIIEWTVTAMSTPPEPDDLIQGNLYEGLSDRDLARKIEYQFRVGSQKRGLNPDALGKGDFLDAAQDVRDRLSGRLAPPPPASPAGKLRLGRGPEGLGKTVVTKGEARKASSMFRDPLDVMFRSPTAMDVGAGPRAGDVLRQELSPLAPVGAAVDDATVPGVVTARSKRGGRFPKKNVLGRYRQVFGRGAYSPTALTQRGLSKFFRRPLRYLGRGALGAGGLLWGADVATDVAKRVADVASGEKEAREERWQGLMLGVQAMQERMASGIVTPEDAIRKQRLQDSVDFKTMMLQEKDPSLAQLMMGLPETTQSEFIIGARPNIKQLRDTVLQHTLAEQVQRER